MNEPRVTIADDGSVHVDFEKPITALVLSPSEAIQLGEKILGYGRCALSNKLTRRTA